MEKNKQIKVDEEDFKNLIKLNLSNTEKLQKYDEKFRILTEKVDFYSKLSVVSDYDRGFLNAFEIMKRLLKGGDSYGR